MHARRLWGLLECYNLDVRNNDPTHDRGGQLDVVVTRREQSCSAVTTYDAGLSDQKLLTWAVDGSRADPPVVTVTYRSWRAVSMDDLRAALNASSLCMPDQWTARSVDDLALLHDTVFTELADRFAPLRQVTRRPQQPDPWFDADCRAAKRLTRRLERTAAKSRTPW